MSNEWIEARLLLSKDCNNKQPCFETGVHWGNLNDVMCKYLGEKHVLEKGITVSWCYKYQTEISLG
jgi:hypothetical protein